MRDMADFSYTPHTIDVVSAGTMTTVQDWPGRVGYWEVGVPPCGPFDSLSLRLANALVGNPEGTAGLEITMTGPTLRFNSATTIAVVGASALMLKRRTPLAGRCSHNETPPSSAFRAKARRTGSSSLVRKGFWR